MSSNVLNFISTVDNYNIFTDPKLDINTNLITLISLLENWRKYQSNPTVEKGVFNFISSWFVYGQETNPESRGTKESDPCDPKGFYSITKRAAEQLLISYCHTHKLNYRILRLSNVLGVGDMKVSAKKNALQFMTRSIKMNNPIKLYNNGEFYRDYIHIDDCVDAIKLVTTDGMRDQIYNIGNGKPILFKNMIDMAIDITGSKSVVEKISPPPFHKTVQIDNFWMDNSKLRDLGYSPKFSPYDMIKSILS